MKHYTFILLMALCLTAVTANAQTPFDAFAPETSRPMLGLDAITARANPSRVNSYIDSVLSTESSMDDISKWLSVDPLADKYPNISPYAYCSWNPVKFVDPNGERIIVGTPCGRIMAMHGINTFEAKVIRQLEELKTLDPCLARMITDLEDSPIDFYVLPEKGKHNRYLPNENVILYNPDDYIRSDGQKRPPEAALAHELGHAEDDKNGAIIKVDNDKLKAGDPEEQNKKNLNEINPIFYENIVREKKGYPERGYNYVNGD